MKFGELLKRLRTERGLTQARLAELAGTSDFTIHKGEQADECPWRGGTARAVFDALKSQAAFTPADQRAYLLATKLDALIDANAMAIGPMGGTVRSGQQHEFVVPAKRRLTADERQAVTWLLEILYAAPTDRVLKALRGVAGAMGIQLSSAADPTLIVHGPETHEEGFVVREVGPATPPPSPRATKRRTGT